MLRVREQPLRMTHFIADAHMGGLARLLRMAGFDTLYDNNFQDSKIEAIVERDGRILLTRDRELLKRRTITHGCYVHALKPAQQLCEIFGRLDLARSVRPFTLCLECNTALHSIDKTEVLMRIPPFIREHFDHFSTCDTCQRIFWKGSHWQRMLALLDECMTGSRSS
jgi:uncharacterized protein